jgi:hypothetical protein
MSINNKAALIAGALILALAGGIIAWQFIHDPGPLDSPMSPTAKAFGEDVQTGGYQQACSLLTPDSRAKFEAAGGCDKSIPATVDDRFAASLANVKFSCAEIGTDSGSLHGDGSPAVAAPRTGCGYIQPAVFFRRVGGKWLMDLSPKGIGSSTITAPTGGGGAAGTGGTRGKKLAHCIKAAGKDIARIRACVG